MFTSFGVRIILYSIFMCFLHSLRVFFLSIQTFCNFVNLLVGRLTRLNTNNRFSNSGPVSESGVLASSRQPLKRVASQMR